MEGKKAYVYFNHDAHGWAVENTRIPQSMLETKKLKP